MSNRKMWAFNFTCTTCSDVQSLTSKGLYNRVRKFIDLTCHYYLAAEYLECISCRRTFISYDACLLFQLPDAYQVRFPVILTRKYACDRAVVNLMRTRTLVNSPTAVCHDVHEMQAEDWMRRTISYLTRNVTNSWNYQHASTTIPLILNPHLIPNGS